MVALKRSLILVFVMVSMVISAQDSFVTENYNDEKIEGRFDQFIAKEDGYIFMTAHTGEYWIVHKVDPSSLKSIKEWKADMFEYDGIKPELVSVTMSSEGFHHAFMTYNRGRKEISFLEVFIAKNGEVTEPRLLGSLQDVGHRDDVNVHFSKNRNRVCVSSLLDGEAGVGLFVFDESCDVILNRNVRNPFAEQFTLMDIKVSNAGDVWLTGFRQAESIPYSGLKASKGYVVLKVDDDASAEMFDLKKENRLMVGVSVTPDEKRDTVMVHGFYADEEDGYFNGIYQAQIGEEELDEYSDNHFEMDKNYLTELDEWWEKSRSSELSFVGGGKLKPFKGLAPFHIKSCFLYEDGNVGIVAERWYYYLSAQYAGTIKDDLLVMKLSPDEGVIWKKKVSKKGSEVLIYEGTDEVSLLFLGNIENREAMLNGGITTKDPLINKYGVLYVSKVSSNGEVSLDLVSNWAKKRSWFTFEISQCQSVDDKSLVLYLKYGGRPTFKLSRLSL